MPPVVAPAQGRALLEPIQQPLYSTAVLNNAILPRVVEFFSYGQGDLVAGAGDGRIVSNPLHTNLLTARQLSAPKTFLVEEVSVHWIELTPPRAANAAGALDASLLAANILSNALTDLLLAWYTGVFSMSIGGLKDYIECPLPLVPQNTGIVGFSGRVATVAAIDVERTETFHPSGEPYSLGANPVFIPSLQEFDARVEWLAVTRVTMLLEHSLICYLDGRQGREIL